ncbi:BnaA09g06840D [Brassica napus]|uniref:BnaA09g06840D protein n=2 Tax=Brassica napus TaxID=3708 RepID=A0A078G099_BRANA|nr:BnaA09g06840D [Brassica napus]
MESPGVKTGGCRTGLVSSEARLFLRSDKTRFQFDDCSGSAVAEMDKLRRLCCVSHSLSSLLLDWSLLGSCSDLIVQRWSAEAPERLRR